MNYIYTFSNHAFESHYHCPFSLPRNTLPDFNCDDCEQNKNILFY